MMIRYTIPTGEKSTNFALIMLVLSNSFTRKQVMIIKFLQSKLLYIKCKPCQARSSFPQLFHFVEFGWPSVSFVFCEGVEFMP